MNKYLYREDKEGPDDWSTWETEDGYHSAAERIAEELDCQQAEYPEERTIWLRDVRHDTARVFTVTAETVRDYSAHEESGK